MNKLIEQVKEWHHERNLINGCTHKDQLAKLMEEVGELSEAMLSVTSKNNGKKKIWNDVSIEAIDVLIMAADIALTIPPDCTLTNEEWRLHLRHALTRKLRKWSEQLDENKTIT